MNVRHPVSFASLATLLCVVAAGCLNLKPKADPTRYFLLTRTASKPLAASDGKEDVISLGIAPVAVPAYLTKPWMVIRTSGTEIRYSDFNKWGEHLDKGIQRVLAEDLSLLLGTDQIHLSAWKQEDVQAELTLSVHQFEVDTRGQVVLEAQWQLSGKHPFTGQRRIEVDGPDPASDPAGAVRAMSQALDELSRVIASEIEP